MDFNADYLKKGIFRVMNVHAFSIAISAFMTFFAPKLLGTYDYGLWQLYLLYVGYIGLFHFGWLDGLYLRHAGIRYDDLNKKELSGELYIFTIIQFIVSLFVIGFAFFNRVVDKRIIIIFCGLALLFVNTKFYYIYILQATGKVKEFTNIAIIHSLLQCILFIIYKFFINNYLSIVLADASANFLSLLLSLYYCRDICFYKKSYIDDNVRKEIKLNIFSGSKLMIANVLSLLTTGIIRIGIEKKFGVSNFGIISLALTFSALCINIFNSMGVVFIPLIKSKTSDVSKKLYENLHVFIDLIVFFLMIFYYPVKIVFSAFMPDYIKSFEYLAITFPIMYFGCIQSLLHITYLKAFRKEKYIFLTNFFIIVFSLIITYVGTKFLNNLDVMVIAIVIIYVMRNIVYEYFISKSIYSRKLIYILQSVLIPLFFVFSNYYIGGYKGTLMFLIIYILWIIINKKYILNIKKVLVKNL